MIRLHERTPLYMVMITLGSALAAVTQWWVGLLSFALVFGVIEAVHCGFNRLLSMGQRHQ
jgi:hypothetical protein